MATYVLVHGSWQGGWVWKFVADKLRAAGHVVYNPSLDGCGERNHALRAGITLDTQGREVADLMFYEDLRDVILVGTSSGGMVILRAAELARDRIRRLVFVDALAPMPGETVSQINGRPSLPGTDIAYGLSPEEAKTQAFGDVPEPLRQWAIARYTRHPRAATEDQVDLHEFWSQKWTVDVLRGSKSGRPPAEHQRRTAEQTGGTYAEIDGGHHPMLTNIDETAEYLLRLA